MGTNDLKAGSLFISQYTIIKDWKKIKNCQSVETLFVQIILRKYYGRKLIIMIIFIYILKIIMLK